MTQEEKLKEAKRLYKTANSDQRYVLESLFPELKESEDEKIRKNLIEIVKQNYLKDDVSKYVAWLEKQGEQKPDKVEPKFHEGDWVVDSQGLIHQIERVVKIVTTHTFGYDIVGGGYFNDDNEGVHLWTIEDANIGIYKEIKDKWWHSYIYPGCDNRLYGFSGGLHIQSNTKPATKEQRDILEKAMVDAGYTFDFENEVIRYIF